MKIEIFISSSWTEYQTILGVNGNAYIETIICMISINYQGWKAIIDCFINFRCYFSNCFPIKPFIYQQLYSQHIQKNFNLNV